MFELLFGPEAGEALEPVDWAEVGNDGEELQPAKVIGALLEGELDAATWEIRVRELGIADLLLATPVAAL